MCWRAGLNLLWAWFWSLNMGEILGLMGLSHRVVCRGWAIVVLFCFVPLGWVRMSSKSFDVLCDLMLFILCGRSVTIWLHGGTVLWCLCDCAAFCCYGSCSCYFLTWGYCLSALSGFDFGFFFFAFNHFLSLLVFVCVLFFLTCSMWLFYKTLIDKGKFVLLDSSHCYVIVFIQVTRM